MPVTVISSMSTEFTPLIRAFAEEQCGSRDVELILHPGSESALVGSSGSAGQYHMQHFAVCDILRTRAELTIRRGPRQCLIIGVVSCRRTAHSFGEYTALIKREEEAVRRWRLFSAYRSACFTADPIFVPI